MYCDQQLAQKDLQTVKQLPKKKNIMALARQKQLLTKAPVTPPLVTNPSCDTHPPQHLPCVTTLATRCSATPTPPLPRPLVTWPL